MKRTKHHKIKKEKPESSSHLQVQEEHDLAYYIHDRVELMHQVFSLLKYKELKAMAPDCVRNLAIGDLEELCTEELLGISSKRLLAILDGVEPPSDTESSSPSPPPELETISLDSISSDEELLTSSSKKKKHKHHRRGSKSKSKKKDKSDKLKEAAAAADENSELSKASRAGLTVLELLELQARARAIRAQLQQEQANKRPSETTAAESSHHSSDNEVEIKEERPEVVEISSEDEKPDVEKLKKKITEKPSPSKANNTATQKAPPEEQQNSQKVTKRVNDLIITVPQTSTRKIKLNRNKVIATTPTNEVTKPTETNNVTSLPKEATKPTTNNSKPAPSTSEKSKESKPKKKKKDKKKKAVEKDGSDHDEITLQLSDSEKMDLLEDLDESRKNYEKVSSSSEDTESSSSDSDESSVNTSNDTSQNPVECKSPEKEVEDKNERENSLVKETSPIKNVEESPNKLAPSSPKEISQTEIDSTEPPKQNDETELEVPVTTTEEIQQETTNDNVTKSPIQNTEDDLAKESQNIDIQDSPQQQPNNTNDEQITSNDEGKDADDESRNEVVNLCSHPKPVKYKSLLVTASSNATRSVTVVDKTVIEEAGTSHSKSSPPQVSENNENVLEINTIDDIPVINENADKPKESLKISERNDESPKENEQDLSDGELSDRQSSEIEAIDVQPEVVCISDEESPKKKSEKKKKKKEKKCKKEKKSKKSKSDFREGSDQNFYKDANRLSDHDSQDQVKSPNNETTSEVADEDKPIDLDSDDVYEILELSDDSSCYEVEGTVLSKEPTTEEIEALSARIDEIEREDVVTEEQIRHHEEMIAEKTQKESNEPDDENVENISWKDRYLDSKKVKKVLTTANILNALRKKNKELKKKIQDSKKKEEEEEQVVAEEPAPVEHAQLEEGSIEQYHTLLGSTKYVDPVKEPVDETQDSDQNKTDDKEPSEKLVTGTSKDETNVMKEMKKDARQLLKMYKKLLKHNDMNKQKDPNKKKKKKLKKKDKQNSESDVAATNLNLVVNT